MWFFSCNTDWITELNSRCSSSIIPLCKKKTAWRHGLPSLEWKNSMTSYPSEHAWDELECWLHPTPPQPISVPDLINAIVAEWSQILKAMLENVVESLKLGTKTGMGSLTCTYQCDGQVSRNIWSYSVYSLIAWGKACEGAFFSKCFAGNTHGHEVNACDIL